MPTDTTNARPYRVEVPGFRVAACHDLRKAMVALGVRLNQRPDGTDGIITLGGEVVVTGTQRGLGWFAR